MALSVSLPKDGEGFEAEVKIGDDLHLILKAVNTVVGPVMRIYDAKAKRWNEPQWAADIDDAKAQAEAIARAWNRRTGRKGEFPALDWQATG
jgi:hypothetical protein